MQCKAKSFFAMLFLEDGALDDLLFLEEGTLLDERRAFDQGTR